MHGLLRSIHRGNPPMQHRRRHKRSDDGNLLQHTLVPCTSQLLRWHRDTHALTCVRAGTTSTPSWCSDDPMNWPDEGFSVVDQSAATQFATYQVVLTAGLEKLSATQAATPTMGSAVPTGSANSTATSDLSESAAAAAKVVGGKTLIAGIGAAVAAYFL
jgi:hypothetical protein